MSSAAALAVASSVAGPPPCNPPDDLRKTIDTIAEHVARQGPAAEETMKASNRGISTFAWFFDPTSEGYRYYKWKVQFCQAMQQSSVAPTVGNSVADAVAAAKAAAAAISAKAGIPATNTAIKSLPQILAEAEQKNISGYVQAPGGVGRVFIPPPPSQPEVVQQPPARERSPGRRRGFTEEEPAPRRRGFKQEADAPRRRGFTEEQIEERPAKRRAFSESAPEGPRTTMAPLSQPPRTLMMGTPGVVYKESDDLEAFGLQPKSSDQRPAELPSNQRACAGIGGWLPSSELSKYTDPVAAAKAAEEEERKKGMFEANKLDEQNIGFQMLQKQGWAGAGLGASGSGVVDPLAVKTKDGKDKFTGIGMNKPEQAQDDDDAYSLYKKRMMKAYQYRPHAP